MDSSKLSNRWNAIHQLIKQERTGALREFAKRVDISKSQLSNELDAMKAMGAPIEFCKIRKTYYYTHRVEFHFGFKPLGNNELTKLTGGNLPLSKKYFCLSSESGQAGCNIAM